MSIKDLNTPEIKAMVSLKSFNTWKIGGVAQFLTEPKNIAE